MRKQLLVLLLVLLVLSSSCASNPEAKPSPQETGTSDGNLSTIFGISYPPVQNQEQIDFSIAHMVELGAKVVRISAIWENREPEKGNYYWSPMDKRVNGFYENGISVLLTIPADGPKWACSEIRNQESCVFKEEEEESFSAFVEALMTRYSGKVEKIQFANEWNGGWGFAGTKEELTRYMNIVYDEIKEHSPETQVVLGGFTRGVSAYLLACEQGDDTVKYPLYFLAGRETHSREDYKEQCSSPEVIRRVKYVRYVLGNARYDMVDLHLYDEVENFDEYYYAVKKEVDVPVIITELGVQEGFSTSYETDLKTHAERVKEILEKINSLDVPEAYYFNLVDGSTGPHKQSGLMDADLKRKTGLLCLQGVCGEVGGV